LGGITRKTDGGGELKNEKVRRGVEGKKVVRVDCGFKVPEGAQGGIVGRSGGES